MRRCRQGVVRNRGPRGQSPPPLRERAIQRFNKPKPGEGLPAHQHVAELPRIVGIDVLRK